MKSLSVFISSLLLCFGSQALFAQDSLSVIGKFAKDHPWTLEFSISSNLTLSSFQGSSISLGKFASDYQKYRIGVSIDANNSSGDQNGNHWYADTLSGTSTGTSTFTNYSVQISLQYLTYATPNGQTSFYYGIGPIAGFERSKQNSNSSSTSSSNNYDENVNSSTSNRYSFGLLGSFGVEWFFSDHISLHAEYGLALQYSSTKGESEGHSRYTNVGSTLFSYKNSGSTSSTEWRLNGQRVLFGGSINF